MYAHTARTRRMLLAGLAVFALLLTACSFVKEAGVSTVKTKVAENVPTGLPEALETRAAGLLEGEETVVPEGPVGEATDIRSPIDNLVKLAPVHVVSSYQSKMGNQVVDEGRVELDLDAKGNQHVRLHAGHGGVTEMYIVDQIIYVESSSHDAEKGQFSAVGELDEESGLSVLFMYGGAFVMALNDLEDAKKVGRESVNGFQTDKYEIKIDLLDLGLGGAVGGAAGFKSTYEG